MVEKILKKARERARAKTYKFRKEFKKQATTAILAALGFLIALSWRDFIVDTVNTLVTKLGVSDQLYLYKLFSALLITFLAILGIMIISKIKIKEDTQKTNKNL